MPDGPEMSSRRARENQRFLEEVNERLKQAVREVRREDDDEVDAPFRFFCECADLGCRDRLEVLPSRLEAIHAQPDRHVVLPGHEDPSVERVVDQEYGYLIVRKL